jgi:hypothetical protein
VCRAYRQYNDQVDATPFGEAERWPHEILADLTGAPEIACIRAIERAGRRNYIASPLRLKVATLTGRGKELLRLGQAPLTDPQKPDML